MRGKREREWREKRVEYVQKCKRTNFFLHKNLTRSSFTRPISEWSAELNSNRMISHDPEAYHLPESFTEWPLFTAICKQPCRIMMKYRMKEFIRVIYQNLAQVTRQIFGFNSCNYCTRDGRATTQHSGVRRSQPSFEVFRYLMFIR